MPVLVGDREALASTDDGCLFDSGVAMEQIFKYINSIDPQGGGLALLWFVVIGGSLFFVAKVWPWVTTVYFPAKNEERKLQIAAENAREDRNTTTLTTILTVVDELKIALHQLNENLQKQNQWLLSTFMRPDEAPLDKGK